MESAGNRMWYYAAGSEKKGPHTVAQLIELARANTIMPNTLVWTEGMAAWEPLDTVPVGAEIHAQFGAPSPPSFQPQGYQVNPNQAPNQGSGGGASVGFVEAIQLAFQKYADFRTRIGRSEFWFFILFSVLGGLATAIMDMVLFGSGFDDVSPINAVFSLALLVPSLSASARRLHDIDRTGWWQLIVLVPLIGIITLIVFWCSEGTRGRNRFG